MFGKPCSREHDTNPPGPQQVSADTMECEKSVSGIIHNWSSFPMVWGSLIFRSTRIIFGIHIRNLRLVGYQIPKVPRMLVEIPGTLDDGKQPIRMGSHKIVSGNAIRGMFFHVLLKCKFKGVSTKIGIPSNPGFHQKWNKFSRK